MAGSASPGDFSVEAVVAESPDLYVIRLRLFDAVYGQCRSSASR
ncbi:hypothetical protein [Paracoccus mutanolyticus]|nr:hypothetical protein [Paracoccus mutanolyticus]